jgi:hypothetical protein
MSRPTFGTVRGTAARWVTWAVLLVAAVTLTPVLAGGDTPVRGHSSGVHGVQPYRLPAGAPLVTWWSEKDEHALYGRHSKGRSGPPEPMRRHSLAKW